MLCHILFLLFTFNIILVLPTYYLRTLMRSTYKSPYRSPTPPTDYPVCGFSHGVWKTFNNINALKHQQHLGRNWKFYSYGYCPRPADYSTDTYAPICAKFENEIRSFNIFSLQLEKFTSSKNWTTVRCPLTNMSICATDRNEKRLFKDLVALALVKFATGKDWFLELCPDLTTPICFKFENKTKHAASSDVFQDDTISWIIVPCTLSEASTTIEYKTTTSAKETTVTNEQTRTYTNFITKSASDRELSTQSTKQIEQGTTTVIEETSTDETMPAESLTTRTSDALHSAMTDEVTTLREATTKEITTETNFTKQINDSASVEIEEVSTPQEITTSRKPAATQITDAIDVSPEVNTESSESAALQKGTMTETIKSIDENTDTSITVTNVEKTTIKTFDGTETTTKHAVPLI